MCKRKPNEAYVAPELSTEALDMKSILCQSWTDGSIGDDLVNDFGEI